MVINVEKILLNPNTLRIIANFMENKPILVTGAHRSGTTWVGKILSLYPTITYIEEPFNYQYGILSRKNLIKIPFPYITDKNGNKYFNALKRILYFDNLHSEYAPHHIYSKGVSTLFALRRILYFRFFSSQQIRALNKDPLALFAAEWLEKAFNMKVVITIRHPAGFASSLKRLNWRFDFKPFLQQKELMEDYLGPFEEEMRMPNKDIIYESALLWKCLYYVVDKYRQRHPDWIFIRHEDLCRNPVKEFGNLYNRLKLPFSYKIREKIKEYSSFHNPIEPPNNEVHYLKRNSRSLTKQWKRRLTKEEIKRIRDITGELSYKYYSEDEW